MKFSQLQKKVKFINNAKGKPVEAILPYEAYTEYVDMKISIEFYKSMETQKSIERAKKDVAAGRFKIMKIWSNS